MAAPLPNQPEASRWYVSHRRNGSRKFVVIDRETGKVVGRGYRYRANALERIHQLELEQERHQGATREEAG